MPIPARAALIAGLAAVAGSPAQTFYPAPVVTTWNSPTRPFMAGATTLVIHDFSGDGVPDVMSDPQYDYVLALGNGDGTFAPTTIETGVPSAIFTTILGARDVNGDGLDELYSFHLDNRARWSFFIRTWTPTGSLVATITVPAELTDRPEAIDKLVVEDIDGDGRTELVRVPTRPGPIRIWRFVGTAMTEVTPSPAPMAEGRRGAIGDADGDGLMDLVTFATSTPNTVLFYRQTAGLSFAVPQQLPLPTSWLCSPCGFAIAGNQTSGDVNGDGLLDYVVTGRIGVTPAARFSVAWTFYGSRTGSLLPQTPPAPPGMGFSVRRLGIQDVDLDGSGDLVFGSTLHRVAPTFAGGTGGSIAIDAAGTDEGTLGDIDGDGDPDLVYAVFPPLRGGGVGYGLAVSLNPTVGTPACTTSSGLQPAMTTGTPAPGNTGFAVDCTGLTPGATAILLLSLAPGPVSFQRCVFGAQPGSILLPAGSFGVATTGPTGAASVPIPLAPGMQALPNLYAQWIALDPAGPGGSPRQRFSLSAGRRIRVW